MAPVLEVEALVKKYPKLTALDGVSLSIEPGEIFALLGPNGAGKTTLIGAVCGLVKKTSGKIKAFGLDLDEHATRARFDIGLVPQEVNFDPFFTVREALEFQLGYFGRPKDPERVKAMLEAMTLTAKAGEPTRSLSGGMKRRLLIAKALIHRPKLVFLDEPTAGVDVELRRDLWAYVRKLRDEGTTVVLTTHYLEEAEALADRVGIINKGKLLLMQETKSLLAELGERKLRVKLESPIAVLPAGIPGELEADRQHVVFVERRETERASEVLARLFAANLKIADVSMHPSKLEDVLISVLHAGEAS